MKKTSFDPAKRQTIKLIGGSAMIVAAPSVAASVATGVHSIAIPSSDITETSLGSNSAKLAISLQIGEESILSMTNHSDQLVIVRHVHPGIVHAGHQSFDINSVFERSAYAIAAGGTRRVPIKPTASLASEVAFPRSRYRREPQRIVSVTGYDQQGVVVNSTRSFFA